MDWFGLLKKVASALAGPLFTKGKQIAKLRAAAERPAAVSDRADSILNDALRQLGVLKASDPWWSRLVVEGEAKLVRPEEFQKPHMRTWLSIPEVARQLKAQARARTVGASGSSSEYERLVESLMEVSLEDRQHAESAVIVAIAFLVESLQGATKDSGTVAVVQALSSEQNRRFDAVDQRLDELAEKAISAPSSGSSNGVPLLKSLRIPSRQWAFESSPPAALLRAEFGVVPFSGRSIELDRIQAWLAQSTNVALALVTGPGGRGKTRLAIEAATRSTGEDWRAGFVSEDGLTPLLDAWTDGGKLLLVVDYAEDDPAHLIQALQTVRAAGSRPDCKLRLLLLARNAGDWWQRVQSAGGDAADLTHHPETFLRLRLSELASDEKQAIPLLRLARDAFRNVLHPGTPVTDAEVEPCSREALLIFAQALLLELGETHTQESESSVLDYLLSRERGFWHRALGRHGLHESHWRLFEILIAVVTLAGGMQSTLETARLLKLFSEHFALDVGTSETMRIALVAVYGAGDRVEPLQPDRLGELLVASHLEPEVLSLASFRERV